MESDRREELKESILTNEFGVRMLDTVAPIYDYSEISLYTFQAFGIVLSKEKEFIDGDLIAQIFPQTATWGLKYWEDEYGVTTDESKSIEERRAYLMSVMFKKRPITPHRIKKIVLGVTGCDCIVYENVQPNTIKIIIYGYVPGMITALRQELDKKLSAHITYILQMSEHYDISTSTYTGCNVSSMEHYELEEV